MYVVVNTDCSLKPGSPIDDAVALVLALKSKEINITGVVTSNGVENKINAAKNVKNILRMLDIRIPVGYGKKAVEIIKRSIREYDAMLCSIAPLTAFANALEEVKECRGIYIMGGCVEKRIDTLLENPYRCKKSEFNFWKDAKAAKEIISSKKIKKKVILPYNTCLKVPLTDEIIDYFKKYRKIHILLNEWKKNFERDYLYDPLLLAILLNRKIIRKIEKRNITIVTRGFRKGCIMKGKHEAEFILDVDKEAFIETLALTI